MSDLEERLQRVAAFKHFRALNPDKCYTSPEAEDAIAFAEEIEHLRRELAEAERDVARYRWLREANIVDWDAIPFPAGYNHPDDTLDDTAKMFDASIDACMAAESQS